MTQNASSPINSATYYSNDSHLVLDTRYDDIMTIALYINKYYLWAILVTGFPGNLATIITISRMRILRSFTIYVVLLAVLDNLAIAVKTTLYHLLQNHVNVKNSGCRTLSFLGNFLATFANWILVLMAVERLVAVRFPLKIKKYLGFRTSVIAICVVGCIIGGAYAPVLWIYMYDEEKQYCGVTKESPEVLIFFLYWLNVSLFAFIPFVVLFLCNIFIVRLIKISFRLRNAMSNQQVEALRRRSSCYETSMQRQIMLMLFTATLVFVVLLFPICVFRVADRSWPVTSNTRGYAIKYLFNQIAYVLCDSTHAVNFYLYFLSAKKFRTHFMSTFFCPKRSPRPVSL